MFRDRFPHRSLFGLSVGDRLVNAAHGFEVQVLRFEDGRVHASFELHGNLPIASEVDAADVLRSVIKQLQLPRDEEGGAA